MKLNKKMENYQNMLRLCMICTPIFTILTAFSAFGWNYYGLKIKEIETQKKVQTSNYKESIITIQNVFNVGGDLVKGDKNVGKRLNKKNETNTLTPINFSEATLDIGNTNSKPNPYFTYENNLMDFIVDVFVVGNSIAYVESKTLTLVRFNKENLPFDSKSFHATDIHGNDLIYSNKPFSFSQKMGNLTAPLFENLFVVIDIKYSNEAKTLYKSLRKIYSVKIEYAKSILPQATAEQYSTIDKYLISKI